MALRLVFESFCWAIVLFGVVLSVLDLEGDGDPLTWSMVVAGIGIASLVIRHVTRRPLSCTDPDALAGSYRARMFVQIALGEVPALLGSMATFLTSDIVPWLVGAAFTAVSFVTTAPTRRRLARNQDELANAGCGLDLVTSLRATPTPPPRDAR